MAKYPAVRYPSISRRLPLKQAGALIIIIFLAVYVAWALTRPMPTLRPRTSSSQLSPVTASAVPWPTYGQAALGVDGYGLIATQGAQVSHPIASIAKTILAIQLLQRKPLKAGEQGPTITMTQADVDLYKSYLAQNGSVVPVQVNEDLTEYQALQALLLPSGDNIADTLAIWGFGSIDNYLSAANAYAKNLGLAQTHLADPSGLSPQSVSSAQDLVILAHEILKEPSLVDIVSQPTAKLPVAGDVKNVNRLLGQDNIVGIKTGNTDEAGGCFLFATKAQIGGKAVTVVGAILGGPNLATTLHDSQTVIKKVTDSIQPIIVAHAGETVGSYQVPWGKPVNLLAKDDLTAYATAGTHLNRSLDFQPISAPHAKVAMVGSIGITTDVNKQTVEVVLASSISRPPVWWKLFHPRGYM